MPFKNTFTTYPFVKKITDSEIKKQQESKTLKKNISKDKKLQNSLLQIRHYDFDVNKPFKPKTKIKTTDKVRVLKTAPTNVEIKLEPSEGENIVYHITPGFTSLEQPMAQVSVAALLYNKGSKSIDLDKVVFEYKKGATTIKKEVFLPSDQLIIDPFFAWWWQNSRPYHEPGDVVFLQAPFPDKITISFYFKDYSSPVSVTKNIVPYNKALALPFKSTDFGKDEYVTGYSMHGGGDQVFAYDVGVSAYTNDGWSSVHPEKAGDKNEHHRIWGKSLYAMADGIVLHFENRIPNNTKLDGSDENLKKQKDELWGSFDYGGSGNHFYIRHGDVVALYAHMQKGSLNTNLMQIGKVVKKGDFLGKAGNSGNSTGPHTHLHIKKYKNDTEPEGGAFRPLLFNNGYTIGQANYPQPKSNVNWAQLNIKGIPGLKSKACFVHPSDVHPYCAYPTNWGEVCRFGVPESIYQTEFDKAWTCGYYPVWVDAYEFLGKVYFNVIFRPSKNVQWVARHGMDGNTYQAEFDKWSKSGFRLININSYVKNGKARYAAVWILDNSLLWFAYHGMPLAEHESKFKDFANQGWVPRNMSCISTGGKIYVTALWEKKNTGGFYLKPVMTLEEFVDHFDQYTNKEKFKLVYLDAYLHGGKPFLSGIWYKNENNFNTWFEKYNLTTNQFQTTYNNMLKNGFLTRCIAGYQHGLIPRFEGIWSK